MNKIMTLFKREYRAAVRTKSFIIGLILVPIFMGGGFLAVILMENRQDTDDKKIVVIDHSGLVEDALREAVNHRNQHEIYNHETGEKIMPAYPVSYTHLTLPTKRIV